MPDNLTPAGLLLRDRIAGEGPVAFREFMQAALYHPRHGYYTRNRDPFGKQGDFYTAAQLQPVFGRLVARIVRDLLTESSGDTVVDLGAGREEMRETLGEYNYVAIDATRGALPTRFRGVVFANEFFDALPIDSFEARKGLLYERRVCWKNHAFDWTATPGIEATPLPDGFILERCPSIEGHLQRIAAAMDAGYLLIIDYGYTDRERIRFPQGTLMSYRDHHSSPDVLSTPGERDITAHVDFTALERNAGQAGFETIAFESLASTLLRAGKRDEFAEALAGDRLKHAQQLKTLLFEMGETFRTLLMRRVK